MADKTMDDLELLSILESEKRTALGYLGGQLSEDRRKALSYYNGELFGNEIEGRSQYVSTEVRDTIEWIMPSLLKIFTAGDRIVRFEPQGPEDEQEADTRTDYINYIFQRQNNGFLTLYTWFKDALLQKNGFVKVYWEKYSTTKKEKYEGLTDDQFMMLTKDENVEVLEHTALPGPMGVMHDVTIKTKRDKGKVCIDPVPPEEMLVNRTARYNIRDARYVAQRTKKTVSELREMGFKNVDDLRDDDEVETSLERFERNKGINDWQVYDDDSQDKATRGVWITEAYMLVDYDGDGIAELRQVFYAGNKILEWKNGGKANEEVDTIPFCHLTPIIMPHRMIGMSVADLVMDIQELKSTYLRQLLDNMYLQNNPRLSVLEGMVNLDDLMVSRPGGIVRRSVISGAIEAVPTPPLPGAAFVFLEYIDSVKEERTGVTKYNTGLDANSLNRTATGINIITQKADARIELIARVFAETGVKDLFLMILELVSKHQDVPEVVRLNNKWVTVDPREWADKFDLSISVGIGYGNKETRAQILAQTIQMQLEAIKMGLPVVTPKNIYNAMSELMKAGGEKSADAFFTDPQMIPPSPPNPDQQLQAENMQLKGQIEQMKVMLKDRSGKLQLDTAKTAGNFQLEKDRMQHEKMMKAADLMHQDKHATHEMKVANMHKAADMMHEDKHKRMDIANQPPQGAA